MLSQYGEAFFARVLRAGFGQDKRVRMTVYRTAAELKSPVHLIAIDLDWAGNDYGVQFCDVNTEELIQRIVDLARVVERRSGDDTTVRRRVFQAYDDCSSTDGQSPTVLRKPNLPRY